MGRVLRSQRPVYSSQQM